MTMSAVSVMTAASAAGTARVVLRDRSMRPPSDPVLASTRRPGGQARVACPVRAASLDWLRFCTAQGPLARPISGALTVLRHGELCLHRLTAAHTLDLDALRSERRTLRNL